MDVAWVGGVDQDMDEEQESEDYSVDIMICLKSRIRLFRIAEEPKNIRHIDLRGCLAASRRGTIACTADNHSYTLVDVVERQQIPLFPISTLFEAPEPENRAIEGTPTRPSQTLRSASGLLGSSPPDKLSRSPSSGAVARSSEPQRVSQAPDRRFSRNLDFSRLSKSPRTSSLEVSGLQNKPAQRAVSPLKHGDDLEEPTTPAASPSKPEKPLASLGLSRLHPHILTPTSNEFLLTTGTTHDDAGVGMFVNLDGDVVRGTIEFSRYPESVIVDGKGIDATIPPTPGVTAEEGFVLAVVRASNKEDSARRIEIQRWDAEPAAGTTRKHWLDVKPSHNEASSSPSVSEVGLRRAMSSTKVSLSRVVRSLSLRRLHVQSESDEQTISAEKEHSREHGEAVFVAQLSSVQTRVLVWSGAQVWWALRNPLVLQLDARLSLAIKLDGQAKERSLHRKDFTQVINEIRGKDPLNELDFLGFKYIRQKVSMLLFLDLLDRDAAATKSIERDMHATEEALTEGEIDPRIVMLIIPALRNEVLQGAEGIWVSGGVKDIVEPSLSSQTPQSLDLLGGDMLRILKRYLLFWQRKKGFGSVSDEEQVFRSVDASLIRVLLQLDSHSPRGPGAKGSVRAEFATVIDRGVACFDRAKILLEDAKRLYLLSRLYQSRKMSAQVLDTWRRILEGEEDAGGEFVDGEMFLRKYLSKIRDRALVEEYGTWLATKNPQVGVQVFADDSSTVKFTAAEAVDILKRGAPDAVKYFLEHLVFGKNVSRRTIRRDTLQETDKATAGTLR